MDKFEYGERVWHNGKQAVIREYGDTDCVIQYLSRPMGSSIVPTHTLSKEKKMTRMELNDSMGIGFIQVGDDLIPATAHMSVGSTGEGTLIISGDSFKKFAPLEFGFETSYSLKPKKIIFNGSTTTCIFEDDTKYHSRPTIDDDFDPGVGVAMCIMKKLYGSRSKFENSVKKGYVQEPKKVKSEKGKPTRKVYRVTLKGDKI